MGDLGVAGGSVFAGDPEPESVQRKHKVFHGRGRFSCGAVAGLEGGPAIELLDAVGWVRDVSWSSICGGLNLSDGNGEVVMRE